MIRTFVQRERKKIYKRFSKQKGSLLFLLVEKLLSSSKRGGIIDHVSLYYLRRRKYNQNEKEKKSAQREKDQENNKPMLFDGYGNGFCFGYKKKSLSSFGKYLQVSYPVFH